MRRAAAGDRHQASAVPQRRSPAEGGSSARLDTPIARARGHTESRLHDARRKTSEHQHHRRRTDTSKGADEVTRGSRQRLCACGCGRPVGSTKRRRFYSQVCQKRVWRASIRESTADSERRSNTTCSGGCVTTPEDADVHEPKAEFGAHPKVKSQPEEDPQKRDTEESEVDSQERCRSCGLRGDALAIGICADCRRPHCWRHMTTDKDDVWRCKRCINKRNKTEDRKRR